MASVLSMFNQRVAATVRQCALRPSLCTPPGVQVQKRCLPVCSVDTNLNRTQIPKDFNEQFSKLIAKTLNKPEKLISVMLRTNVEMWRNENAEPTAAVHIWSVGVFDEQRNPGYSKHFIEFLMSALELPEDRIAIMLHPIERKDAGHLMYADLKAGK